MLAKARAVFQFENLEFFAENNLECLAGPKRCPGQ